jgi:hypothetical protein
MGKNMKWKKLIGKEKLLIGNWNMDNLLER